MFAARFQRDEDGDSSGSAERVVYPMEWDVDNKYVVGEDRTAVMTDICGKC